MAKPTQAPFETLIAPWLDDLYRVAWRLAGNQPDAEDLVQDTCTVRQALLSAAVNDPDEQVRRQAEQTLANP